MTSGEEAERRRLHRKWARRKTSTAEMLRCLDLDRRAEAEAIEARRPQSPDPLAGGDADLFFHARRLGDKRPASSSLPVCSRHECRRHFIRLAADQELCQRCLDLPSCSGCGARFEPPMDGTKCLDCRLREAHEVARVASGRSRKRRSLGGRVVAINRGVRQ